MPVDPLVVRVTLRYRFKTAGILAAPPGLHESILKWVHAVVAANAKKVIEDTLADLRERNSPHNPNDGLVKLDKALDILEANPTWKNYVVVYDASGVFGNPGTRWKATDFQKLTPEKRAKLAENIQRLTAGLRKDIEAERQNRESAIQAKEREIDGLRPYLMPGVEAMAQDEARKEFPLDLAGWVYAQKRDIEKMLRAQAEESLSQMRDLINRAPNQEMAKPFQEVIDDLAKKPLGLWQTITVVLSTLPMKGFQAFWQEAAKTVKILIPKEARPSDLAPLSNVLRHELQHLGQSLLTHALKGIMGDGPGKPSRHIRTPDIRQHMSPAYPGHDPKDPEVVKLIKTLRDQGIDYKDVDFHALDDVEFYTNLADAVERFKGIWRRAEKLGGSLTTAVKLFAGAIEPPAFDRNRDRRDSPRAKWFREMGGPEFVAYFPIDPFFSALRRHATGKWRKAVAELLKAVG